MAYCDIIYSSSQMQVVCRREVGHEPSWNSQPYILISSRREVIFLNVSNVSLQTVMQHVQTPSSSRQAAAQVMSHAATGSSKADGDGDHGVEPQKAAPSGGGTVGRNVNTLA